MALAHDRCEPYPEIMRLVDLPKGNYIRMIKHEFRQNSKC